MRALLCNREARLDKAERHSSLYNGIKGTIGFIYHVYVPLCHDFNRRILIKPTDTIRPAAVRKVPKMGLLTEVS